MKKIFTIALMATLATGMYSCRQKQVGEQKFDWIADRFDDIKVLKYRVPGFDTLSLDEKKLVYYLSQAAADAGQRPDGDAREHHPLRG